MSDIDKLKDIIKNSNRIAVFTGAGVSTESGIKDFRGKDGVSNYTDIPIEILLSHTYKFTKLEYFYIPTSQPCPNKKAKPFPIKLAFL